MLQCRCKTRRLVRFQDASWILRRTRHAPASRTSRAPSTGVREQVFQFLDKRILRKWYKFYVYIIFFSKYWISFCTNFDKTLCLTTAGFHDTQWFALDFRLRNRIHPHSDTSLVIRRTWRVTLEWHAMTSLTHDQPWGLVDKRLRT